MWRVIIDITRRNRLTVSYLGDRRNPRSSFCVADVRHDTAYVQGFVSVLAEDVADGFQFTLISGGHG